MFTAKIAAQDSEVREFAFDTQPTIDDLLAQADLSTEGMSIKLNGQAPANGVDTLVPNGAIVYLHPKTEGGR
ncbi:MAG: hypothetical protein WBK76_00590 [Candidatus Saccharimonadales bacterium]